MKTPLPSDEAGRLTVLREHHILDTPPVAEFDDLVRLAALLCGVPIAAVSLIDEDRQWFKSIIGLDCSQTPRDAAFCAHTILTPEMLIVPDTQKDVRFADNPMVTGDPHLRFYAGMPLLTEDGYCLGSLCIIDKEVRSFTPEQAEILRLLAHQAAYHLQAARRAAERERLLAEKEQLAAENARLASIVSTSEDAIYSKTLEGRITSWNKGAESLYGYSAAEIIGEHVDLLVPLEHRHEMLEIMDTVQCRLGVASLETIRLTKTNKRLNVSISVSPVMDTDGSIVGASIIARDIAQRKHAEEKLEAEREFMNALLESLQEGIVACDAQGTLALLNRAAQEFHGIPEEPLPAEQWTEHFDLFRADGITPLPTAEIPLLRAYSGETVRDAEMVIAPSGSPRRIVLASGQAIYSRSGDKLGAVVAMHDVTDRRRIELELSRLAAIVASSEEAITATTLDGTLVSWNAGAERLYGYSEAEVIGRHASLLSPEGVTSTVETVILRLLNGEPAARMDAVRRRQDGSLVTVGLSFSPIHDADSKIIGASCIARDITAQRQAEDALRESEARLRYLSEAAFEGIAVSRDGIILDANPAFLSLYGYDHDQVIGMTADQFPVPEAQALVRQKVADEEEGAYEVLCQRRDGSTFLAEVRGRKALWDGQAARVTAVRDITERKNMEDALRHSAEAMRAILSSAPVILYAADLDGTITLSEGTGLAALGLAPGEAVGRSVYEFSEGNSVPMESTRRAFAGETVSYDTRIGTLSLHVELRPQHDLGGAVSGLIGVCFDITDRAELEERFRVLFEQSPQAHLLVGEHGIIDCNPAAAALLGCPDKSQLIAQNPSVFSPEYQPDGRSSLEKSYEMEKMARENGSHSFEWVHHKMDGEEFPTEVTLTPMRLQDKPVMLAVLEDLTERKMAEQQIKDYMAALELQKSQLEETNKKLEALATTDGLTGLKNHRAFQEKLAEEHARAVRYNLPLSLLLLDVDQFKQYNDSFGHPAGDVVLKNVAGTLGCTARDTDMAARYGGEEFVVILPQTDEAGALVIAERVRAVVAGNAWEKRPITVSIGISTLSLDTPTPASLIACADGALYHAKEAGRNHVSHGNPFVQPLSRTPQASRARHPAPIS